MSPKKEYRKQITITVDGYLLEWVDEQIEKKTFAGRSHAVDLALMKLKERSEGDN